MAGRPKPPKEFEDIHAILGAAMRACATEDWPTSPHFGGPPPQLDARQQIGVGLWCAAQVDVPVADAAAFDESVRVARAFYDGKALKGIRTAAIVAGELRDRAERPPWIEVARTLAAAVRSVQHGGASLSDVNKFTRECATSAIDMLPAGERRGFLADLDDEMCRRELVVEMAAQKIAATPGAIRYRPRAAKGKKPALVLFELDGGLGLWWKPAGMQRWQLTRGDAQDVLACVPDAHFAGAVASTQKPSTGL
jgi:hypothetical protein